MEIGLVLSVNLFNLSKYWIIFNNKPQGVLNDISEAQVCGCCLLALLMLWLLPGMYFKIVLSVVFMYRDNSLT